MTVLHENTHYRVEAVRGSAVSHGGNEYADSYHVVNKRTLQSEFRTPALPEAIFISEDLNSAMENEAWNWRKKEAEAIAEALKPSIKPVDVFN